MLWTMEILFSQPGEGDDWGFWALLSRVEVICPRCLLCLFLVRTFYRPCPVAVRQDSFFGRTLVEVDALGGFVPTYENPMLPIWLPSLGDEHTSNRYFGVQGTKVWSIPRWVKPDLRMCQVSAMNVPPPSPAEEGTNLWVFWSPQAMLKPFPCL